MEDFRDKETAEKWSIDPTAHNPTRVEQLDILLSILQAEYRQHKTILDIGMGSGILEELIFERIPHAYIIGVDFSRAMLDLAHKRLVGKEGQYEAVVHDLTRLDDLELPDEDYQIAISVQAIHHVPDEHKRAIYRFVYDVLEPGGLFLMLDRIAIHTPRLFDCYKLIWQRLNKLHQAHISEGETFIEHLEKVGERGDLPATLEQNLAWLREAGFETACLHLHANRALFAGRKGS